MAKMRKVLVNGQAWEFSVGRFNAVIKNPSTKKKTIVDFSKLTGRTWDILERGQYRRTSDGMIKPGHVKAYIEEHLAEKPLSVSEKAGSTERRRRDVELAKKAKIAKGPPSVTVLYQEWEESERGWGVRPDGFSLHVDRAHRDAFVTSYQKRQHEYFVSSGMSEDSVPDEYTRISGEPIAINIPAKILTQLDKLGGNYRGFDRNIGVDAAHNLVGLGSKGLTEK